MARFSSLGALAVLAVAALLAAMPERVHGHSYLVKPKARDDFYHRDENNTMGCASSFRSTPTSFKAGETIDVRYWRNNHNGGFIRWALVPLGQPETQANFDKNVFFYTCRESGPECTPKGKASRFKLDLDTQLGDKVVSCGDKITLPDYLPAGDYVLQWIIYGSGWSYGNLGWAEMIWKSCADIRLTTAGAKSKPPCPSFTGGDRVTKLEGKGSDVCFYFWNNAVPSFWYKGDNAKANDGYKFDAPAEVKQCRAKNGGSAAAAPSADGEVGKDDDAAAAPVTVKAAGGAGGASPVSVAPMPTTSAKCNRKV